VDLLVRDCTSVARTFGWNGRTRIDEGSDAELGVGEEGGRRGEIVPREPGGRRDGRNGGGCRGRTTATLGPGPTCGDGAAATATSLSRLPFAFDIVHCSAQHGIEACIDAIGMPVLSRQHTAAAGMAVTNRTSMAAIIVARRFVLDVEAECTVTRTPAAVSVFRKGGRYAVAHPHM
jgi:hypothetical protein